MYRVIASYVAKLKGAVKEGARLYSTHFLPERPPLPCCSMLASTLGRCKIAHRHITTTQICDKRRRTTKESASHDVPI